MGGAACVVIINGNRAYATVENLAENYNNVNLHKLYAAINASCEVVTYASLFLISKGEYLSTNYTDPIIALHTRIIDELSYVKMKKKDLQNVVDELANLLFTVCDNIVAAT